MSTQTGLASIPPLTSNGATAWQYRNTGAVSSGGLTIPNRIGHRRTLLDIFFEPETAGIMLDVTVGDRTFIRLPTFGGSAIDAGATILNQEGMSAIADESVKVQGKGLLWWLNETIPFDFPTATQDESIIILPVTPLGYGSLPGSYNISAVYLDQDTGDVVNKAVPGGSYASRRLYVNMVTNGIAQATAGQTVLDTAITPKALNPVFDNTNTLAGYKFTSYIFAYDESDLGVTTGGNANGKPTRLHINDIDIELFQPETSEGMFIDADIANDLAFSYATETAYIPLNPYVFHQNRRIRMLLDTKQLAGGGSDFGANTQLFAMFGIREPETGT
jgi:hypothetical protein